MKRKLTIILGLLKQFGPILTVKLCIYRYKRDDEKYINLCLKYLRKFTQPLIEKYKTPVDYSTLKIENDGKIPVWVCWWQGEENMPELCGLCYKRLKAMLPANADLRLITLENYRQYVDIPDYIMGKVEKGIINYTKLSNILRLMLLDKFGGLWMDSTIFCSNPIDASFLADPDFWSIKLPEVYNEKEIGQFITKCRWTGFMFKANTQSPIVKFVLEATLLYWKHHDVIIDYYLHNMLIRTAYDNIESAKVMMDKIPPSNLNLYNFRNYMDCKFDPDKYKEITKDGMFHKLTWKKPYKKHTPDGEETLYMKMLNEEGV